MDAAELESVRVLCVGSWHTLGHHVPKLFDHISGLESKLAAEKHRADSWQSTAEGTAVKLNEEKNMRRSELAQLEQAHVGWKKAVDELKEARVELEARKAGETKWAERAGHMAFLLRKAKDFVGVVSKGDGHEVGELRERIEAELAK